MAATKAETISRYPKLKINQLRAMYWVILNDGLLLSSYWCHWIPTHVWWRQRVGHFNDVTYWPTNQRPTIRINGRGHVLSIRGSTKLFKVIDIGKVKVLCRYKSPVSFHVFFLCYANGFSTPVHLANFDVKWSKWPSPLPQMNPTLTNQYWYLSSSGHHYRFLLSLLRSSWSLALG